MGIESSAQAEQGRGCIVGKGVAFKGTRHKANDPRNPMTKRVITSVLLHSPEDLAEYRAACEILQRVTERHLKPEVWEFVRDGEPEIFFRGLRMVRSAI